MAPTLREKIVRLHYDANIMSGINYSFVCKGSYKHLTKPVKNKTNNELMASIKSTLKTTHHEHSEDGVWGKNYADEKSFMKCYKRYRAIKREM